MAQDERSALPTKWMFWYAGQWRSWATREHGCRRRRRPSLVPPVESHAGPVVPRGGHPSVVTSPCISTARSSRTGTSCDPIPDAAAPLTLGWSETDWFFDGRLDEPEIYQRALSTAEIKADPRPGTRGSLLPHFLQPHAANASDGDPWLTDPVVGEPLGRRLACLRGVHRDQPQRKRRRTGGVGNRADRARRLVHLRRRRHPSERPCTGPRMPVTSA